MVMVCDANDFFYVVSNAFLAPDVQFDRIMLSLESCITHTQLHYDDYMKLITDNDIGFQSGDCGLLCAFQLIDQTVKHDLFKNICLQVSYIGNM